MLKNKKIVYALLGALCFAIAAGLLATNSVQSQQGQGDKQTAAILRRDSRASDQPNRQPTGKELDDAATPIVDYDNPSGAASDQDNQRKSKNARFDNYTFVRSQPPPGAGELISNWHWEERLSDLPADASDLVIEGKIADSQAFLSNDKTGVYSEFSIRVSGVLKAAPDFSVNQGDMIVAERVGGRIRYPSGKIMRYRIEGQGSPMKGKKYLFFLAKSQDGNYKLLTAYELQGNNVFALDGARITARGRGQSKFDKHNGKEFDKFLKEVEKAVKDSEGKVK